MSNDEPIPVAVVGAGNMGANHVRVYDELPEADLVGVVEPDAEQARKIHERYGVPVVDRVADIDGARAATVAVPNRFHREVAERCIEAGMDVLVEKPLATSVEDAQAIVNAAEEAGSVLQVGHIEQYNPAVEVLGNILQEEKDIISLEAHRLGPFNEHLSDESVVFDLMIHDIDVIDGLISEEIEQIQAFGTSPRLDGIDHAIGQWQFEGGTLATMTASRVTHGKVRTLRVTTADALITLDYQDQSIEVQRRGIEEVTTVSKETGYRTETVTERPYVKTREPLRKELEAFLSCVLDRRQPRVSGVEGVRAVELAAETEEVLNGPKHGPGIKTASLDDSSTK